MAEKKKPAKKAPAKKAPAKKASEKPKKPVKGTKPAGRPAAVGPADDPLPKPKRPPVKKVVNKPEATKGKSLIEVLRDAIHEANRDLKDVKASLGHMGKWERETWRHYFRRRHLMRVRRKYKRRIVQGLEARLQDAIERKEERKEEKTKGDKNPYDAHGGDIVSFDGRQVVEWIAHDLFAIRKIGWGGYVVSGWRDPAYSESLCYRMCGAPQCPGRCAGRASKHAEKGDGGGAVDVTDYITAERLLYQIGSRLHNDLPYDLVHLSATGH